MVNQRMTVNQSDIFQKARSGKTGTFEFYATDMQPNDNKKYLGSISIVPQTGWIVVVTQSSKDAYASIRKLTQIIFLLGLLAILLSIILASQILKRTLTPLYNFNNVTKQASEGEYNTIIEQNSYKEINELISTFNIMVVSIKSREEALQKSEERFRFVLENVKDAVWSADLSGQYVFLSPVMTHIYGRPLSEMMDNPNFWIEATHPDDQAAVRASHEALLRDGHIELEYRIINADGRVCWISDRKTILRDEHGVFSRMAGILSDITDRKQIEAQLLQSQKMQAIGTLAGGIAHDFNNILSVIIGYTELAREEYQNEKQQQHLQKTLDGAKRAKNLVKQILTFSRQDGHEKKPLDIKVLLKEAVKFLRSSIPATVEINQHITDEDCNIMADPTQMHQVIMNLCTNASHAMKEAGGTLKIELANLELAKDEIPNHPELQPGHYVKLTVSDTGYGIDADNIQKIFDPFFTTKSVDEGTGLGLSVVYGIVKNHGGAINVYSEQGKGAAFHVYLPKIIQTETMEEDTGKPVIGGTERILFVDDEPALVDIGTRMLSSLGYQVTGVLSSVDALDMISKEPQSFDLVITDMTLPKMTGIDLSRKLLQIRPDIPIILCSGIKDPETDAQARSLGIKAYLTKPLTRKELAHAMREVLGKIT